MCNCNNSLTKEQIDKLLQIINKYKNSEGKVMLVLHEVQEYLGYIPYEAQKIIAENLNVPMSDIYGVVTFYSRFSLKPVGQYKIGVCLGTACYVKGADKIIEKIEQRLGIKVGETTEDGRFSLDAMRCLGACGLAPVMTINEDVYGKIELNEIDSILDKYK